MTAPGSGAESEADLRSGVEPRSATEHGPPGKPERRRRDTDDPRAARVEALNILFSADLRALDAAAALESVVADPHARSMLAGDGRAPTGDRRPPAVDAFARSLVLGVAEHREEIDALIARFARRWAISRMPVVDRTVLRLATYELLYERTSPAVVIDEAIGLAKALSTDDSGRYVNGVLESVRRAIAESRADEPPIA